MSVCTSATLVASTRAFARMKARTHPTCYESLKQDNESIDVVRQVFCQYKTLELSLDSIRILIKSSWARPDGVKMVFRIYMSIIVFTSAP